MSGKVACFTFVIVWSEMANRFGHQIFKCCADNVITNYQATPAVQLVSCTHVIMRAERLTQEFNTVPC